MCVNSSEGMSVNIFDFSLTAVSLSEKTLHPHKALLKYLGISAITGILGVSCGCPESIENLSWSKL